MIKDSLLTDTELLKVHKLCEKYNNDWLIHCQNAAKAQHLKTLKAVVEWLEAHHTEEFRLIIGKGRCDTYLISTDEITELKNLTK
jgi:hypothetical protein